MTEEFTPGGFRQQVDSNLFGDFIAERCLPEKYGCGSPGENVRAPGGKTTADQERRIWDEAEEDLRSIIKLATGEGVAALIEEGAHQGFDLTGELKPVSGFLNQALYIHLKHQSVFRAVSILDRTSSLANRFWNKRRGLPRIEPDYTKAALDELGKALAAFYRTKKKWHTWCDVEHCLRRGRYHYFLARPTKGDHATKGATGQRGCATDPAYQVVFLFDPRSGTLDLHAKGDKRVRRDLRRLFARAILHKEMAEETRDSLPFALNRLKYRDFSFPTDHCDKITSVQVQRLRIFYVGAPRQRITFEIPPDGEQGELYDLMERAINKITFPLSMITVNSATIVITFAEPDGSQKPLAIRITRPDFCSLKDTPRDLIAREYLKQWGLDRE